jgi:methylthioribose-1-phosphate isomerase
VSVRSSSRVDTLRYREGQLELIDQRVLPHELSYRAFGSAAEVAEAIRAMVVRGAPAIGCAAAYGVALEAQRLAERALDASEFDAAMERGFKILAESRPTAVNLFWALERMRRAFELGRASPASTRAAELLALADAIAAEDVRICRKLGENGAALLADGARVLTHCNAGALATAGHGTALGVVRSAVEAGKRIAVIADETRPFLQGARLTAWELAQDGIPVTLITDNMAGYLMSKGEIDCAVVGADRIAANGDVANKIGTYSVAVLAKEHGLPFYVVAPTSTFDLTLSSGEEIPIEERNTNEVTHVQGVRLAPEGIRIRNPAFDVTPNHLVSAIVCENGVARPPYVESLRRLANGKAT